MEQAGLEAITEVQVCKRGGRNIKWHGTIHTRPTNDKSLVLRLCCSYIGCNHGGTQDLSKLSLQLPVTL